MDVTTVLVVERGVGLAQWLLLALGRRPSVAVVGPVPDAAGAREELRRGGVDLVLVEADGEHLLALIDGIRAADENVRILVSSPPGADDVGVAATALSFGACGVLVRSLGAVAIEHAFARACAGEIVLPDTRLRSLLDRRAVGVETARDRLATLTARERQVLALLAEGWSTADVAERLGISVGTVQTHVKSVLSKLGVHSKVEAIRLAWRHGTVAVPA